MPLMWGVNRAAGVHAVCPHPDPPACLLHLARSASPTPATALHSSLPPSPVSFGSQVLEESQRLVAPALPAQQQQHALPEDVVALSTGKEGGLTESGRHGGHGSLVRTKHGTVGLGAFEG